jgi:hypothetical protein
MPQSLSQLYAHLIFSTKDRYPFLRDDIRDRVHAYLATVLRDMCSPFVVVAGIEDLFTSCSIRAGFMQPGILSNKSSGSRPNLSKRFAPISANSIGKVIRLANKSSDSLHDTLLPSYVLITLNFYVTPSFFSTFGRLKYPLLRVHVFGGMYSAFRILSINLFGNPTSCFSIK